VSARARAVLLQRQRRCGSRDGAAGCSSFSNIARRPGGLAM